MLPKRTQCYPVTGLDSTFPWIVGDRIGIQRVGVSRRLTFKSFLIKDGGDWPEAYDHLQGPHEVRAAAWLLFDVHAMETLTESETPLLWRVRGRKTGMVLYGLGDTLKSTFGATIQVEDRLLYHYGQWSLNS